MSAKQTPNPFKKVKDAPRVIDEVIPDKRGNEPQEATDANGTPSSVTPIARASDVGAPIQTQPRAAPREVQADEASNMKAKRTTKAAPGKFRTTVDMDRKLNRKVKHYADDLYEVAGGNVPTRDVFEAAIEFAFENEAAFDVFMKARLRQE